MKLSKVRALSGTIKVPGDKSISHRSIMVGALSENDTKVLGFLKSDDCMSTINCFRKMGVSITENDDGNITIRGVGLDGLKAPDSPLDCGNSGTTARIISGILCAQEFSSTLKGDSSLSKRPMRRIIDPLSKLGAKITSYNAKETLPLVISPSEISGGEISTDVSSAQVKSALIFAGLYANSALTIHEPSLSRNHTELMLKAFGADITPGTFENPTTIVHPAPVLHGRYITVPGDISSAAYFIGAGLIVPDSEITIKNVGINPTRAGILTVLKNMNASISLDNLHDESGEAVADITVKTSALKATEISGNIIPLLIDELPLLAVIATQAEGQTIIKDASELRVKESDRIEYMCNGLRAMGADITPTEDGMMINGPTPLHSAFIKTGSDHRIAMSFAIASLIMDDVKPLAIDDTSCVSISYPDFFRDLDMLDVDYPKR
ncbi:MAG: 3-phosphoshikimate 1-carboxyvinyltransferase [Lachnospiraceae bacterium]|nr:3-phosphoshikimate 1-carboxyvinyltransferase [Lachnospiraceae bacterium]